MLFFILNTKGGCLEHLFVWYARIYVICTQNAKFIVRRLKIKSFDEGFAGKSQEWKSRVCAMMVAYVYRLSHVDFVSFASKLHVLDDFLCWYI